MNAETKFLSDRMEDCLTEIDEICEAIQLRSIETGWNPEEVTRMKRAMRHAYDAWDEMNSSVAQIATIEGNESLLESRS
jgi:hypothetical protein